MWPFFQEYNTRSFAGDLITSDDEDGVMNGA